MDWLSLTIRHSKRDGRPWIWNWLTSRRQEAGFLPLVEMTVFGTVYSIRHFERSEKSHAKCAA